VGGPVTGAVDMHCSPNGTLETQHVGMCVKGGAGASGGEDAAPSDDAGGDGESEAGNAVEPVMVLFNNSGYDDDCKYHVSFDSTPIRKNANVTFTVNVQGLDPAGPATGAAIYAEIFLTDTHPSPSNPTATESPPGSGTYTYGPVVFDQSGRWTIRFHFYESCSDAPADSPHGHAAFYIDVP
jgi:hypothetical protein